MNEDLHKFLALVAGGVGIEPTYADLEAAVLPLYEPPIKRGQSLFSFFVQGLFFAMFAEFFEFQPFGCVLFVFFSLII